MNRARTHWACWAIAAVVALTAPVWAQDAQAKKVTQTAGVNNTKMGAYEALAEMSLRAFQKGDIANSAELARILEKTWDRGESGERAAGKPNADLYNQIDKTMDGFIEPILQYNPVRPSKADSENAYKSALAQLPAESMGTYRTEATSVHDALEKDDLPNASLRAKKLMQDWFAGTQELRKSNADAWTAKTQALRLFTQPIAGYHPALPDPAIVESGYKDYLAKLQLADQLP